MATTPPEYRPGVCNIGGSERRHRYRLAAAAYLVALVYAAVVLVSDTPTFLLVGLVVPLSLGTEWLLQARRAFCAGLALSGRFSFDGQRGTVPDDAQPSDRRYGFRLFLVGLGVGAVATAVVYAGATLVA
ncbi:hypothetical protein [Halorarius litoreus]|uniref:hypothetical protein n=1 Tax=Halorarius litoreus TaxID=2962676 RepID=UPI0020CE1BEC|nr:hypothetical protein [Halorarius litoreus]